MSPEIQVTDVITVATIKSRLAVAPGKLCDAVVEIMLDSGSSVSLVQQCIHMWLDFNRLPKGPPTSHRLW